MIILNLEKLLVTTYYPKNGKKQPTDLKRIVDILRNADYSGYIVLEYEDKEDPYKAIPRYLGTLRKIIDE